MSDLPWLVRHGDDVWQWAAAMLALLALAAPWWLRGWALRRRARRARRALGRVVESLAGLGDGATVTLAGTLASNAGGDTRRGIEPGLRVGRVTVPLVGPIRVLFGRTQGDGVLHRGDRVLARGVIRLRPGDSSPGSSATAGYRDAALRCALAPEGDSSGITLVYQGNPRATPPGGGAQSLSLIAAAVAWVSAFGLVGAAANSACARGALWDANLDPSAAAQIASVSPWFRARTLARLREGYDARALGASHGALSHDVAQLDRLRGRCADGVLALREHGQFERAMELATECGDPTSLHRAAVAAYALGRFDWASWAISTADWSTADDDGEMTNSFALTMHLLAHQPGRAIIRARRRYSGFHDVGWYDARRRDCLALSLEARMGDSRAADALGRQARVEVVGESVTNAICALLWADVSAGTMNFREASRLVFYRTERDYETNAISVALRDLQVALDQASRLEANKQPWGHRLWSWASSGDTPGRTLSHLGFVGEPASRASIGRTPLVLQLASLDAMADDADSAFAEARGLASWNASQLPSLRAAAAEEKAADDALPEVDMSFANDGARLDLEYAEHALDRALLFQENLAARVALDPDPPSLTDDDSDDAFTSLYAPQCTWCLPEPPLDAAQLAAEAATPGRLPRWPCLLTEYQHARSRRGTDVLDDWLRTGKFPRCEHCTVLDLLADTSARQHFARALGDDALAEQLRDSLRRERDALLRRDIALPLALLELLPDEAP